ncbi:hypothetical protein, partial [Bacillus safensis]|uniref:hypothetical protein n=1 Tax=Bacillus safensis TaxID=561879 RepID=UPI003F7B38E5
SVAQLGERYLDRVEVAGSSPVGIIVETLARQGFFCFLTTNICSVSFGWGRIGDELYPPDCFSIFLGSK